MKQFFTLIGALVCAGVAGCSLIFVIEVIYFCIIY